MTKDELLEALLVERHNGISWASENAQAARAKTDHDWGQVPTHWNDHDLIRARRRRALVDAWEDHIHQEAM